MKKSILKIAVFIISFLVFSCAEDKDGKKIKVVSLINNNAETKNTNLNISFLLDLSDRIDPKKYPNGSMEYYLRDVAYIKAVSEAFDIHLRKKRVRQMNDNIKIYFDPPPKNNAINNISNNLKYSINRNNASIDLLNEVKKIYATKQIEIYNLAIKDNTYVGSDTWRFFKTKVKDLCIENNYRNILIILSDGYIYHKDTKIKEDNRTTYLRPQDIRDFHLNNQNWEATYTKKEYGFLPATSDLQNLEVLVLGINPDPKNPYEEDVIRRYWSDWFNSMDVGRYEIKTAGLPSDMDKMIKDFILKE